MTVSEPAATRNFEQIAILLEPGKYFYYISPESDAIYWQSEEGFKWGNVSFWPPSAIREGHKGLEMVLNKLRRRGYPKARPVLVSSETTYHVRDL
jgi:hypothetical protein